MSKTKPSLVIYACGGAGTNIAKTFIDPSNGETPNPGFSTVQTVFIDTSISNIASDTAGFFFIKGATDDHDEGSGMIRKTNYKPISDSIPELLHEYRPGNLNIVLHSASGGSGSITGPLLVSELLSQEKNVIVIMIGSDTCKQELQNTIDTILSYQGISTKRGLPVMSIYLDNSQDTMVTNDAQAKLNIILLSALWSGENHGLDGQDLRNFLNYQKVSKYPASLTGLAIYSAINQVETPKGQAVSSVLSFVREGQEPNPGMTVSYHAYGTMSVEASEAIDIPTPIHIHAVQGYYTPIVAGLKEKMAKLEELERINPVKPLQLGDVQPDDNGIVI